MYFNTLALTSAKFYNKSIAVIKGLQIVLKNHKIKFKKYRNQVLNTILKLFNQKNLKNTHNNDLRT